MVTASVKDFGAVGDGVANDAPAVRAALARLGTTGGTLLFPAGIYRLRADQTMGPHWNQVTTPLASLYHSRAAVVIEGSDLSIVGQDATLVLDTAGGDAERDVGFFFATPRPGAKPWQRLRFEGLRLDMDATGNAASCKQPRSILLIGAHEVEVLGCTFISSSERGGYGINLMDCERIEVAKCHFYHVSGGLHAIYCRDLEVHGTTIDRFSEGIDLDKVNERVSVRDCRFARGGSDRDEALDSNATLGLTVERCTFDGCRRALTFNCKGEIAATFEDHINVRNHGWQRGIGLTVSDCSFVDCNGGPNAVTVLVGDQYRRDRFRAPGSRPVENVVFRDNEFTRTGMLLAWEALGLVLEGNRFSEITTKTAEEGLSPYSALYLRSNWPDVPGDSDLVVTLRGNTIMGVNRAAVRISGASSVELEGNEIDQVHRDRSDGPAVIIDGIDRRSTSGRLYGNAIGGNGQGLELSMVAGRQLHDGTRIAVQQCRIRPPGRAIVLQGEGLGPALVGETLRFSLPTQPSSSGLPSPTPPGNVRTEQIVHEVVVPRVAFGASVTASSSIPSDPQAYVELVLSRRRGRLGPVDELARMDTRETPLRVGQAVSLPVTIGATTNDLAIGDRLLIDLRVVGGARLPTTTAALAIETIAH